MLVRTLPRAIRPKIDWNYPATRPLGACAQASYKDNLSRRTLIRVRLCADAQEEPGREKEGRARPRAGPRAGPRAEPRVGPAEGEAEGKDEAEAEVEFQGSPRAKSRRNSRAESGKSLG